ncbi:MAG TPA: hypothetical protein VGA09_12830 [Candidatus Binatia bacterium]
MVRAGVVGHPDDWAHSGYRVIQNPPKRYGIIDLRQLSALCGFSEAANFQRAHRHWVEEALRRETAREGRWSEAIAVGSLAFVEKIKSDLGFRAMHREASQTGDAYMLRERSEAYAGKFTYENDALTLKNTIPWNKSIETTDT